MATKIWLGGAAAINQINTLTPASVDIGDTFTATINGKSVTFTATVATVASVTAGLQAACSDPTAPPEFAEIEWTDRTTYLEAKARTAGKPFTQTSSSVGGSLTTATATANKGPAVFNEASNWSSGSNPVAADDVYIQEFAGDILYNLDAFSADTWTSLNLLGSFTGRLGLPAINLDSPGGGYGEYRAQYLAVGATTVNIGGGEGSGPTRVCINTGSVATTLNIFGTGFSADTDLEAVRWKGTSASNAVNITQGSLGIAVLPGETANVSGGFRIAYETSQDGDVQVRCGSGVTIAAVSKGGGELRTASAITTMTHEGGTWFHEASTVTTLNLDKGTVTYTSTGTITTLNVGSEGAIDFSRDLRSRTVTTCDVYSGRTAPRIFDPHATVTWTNGIDLNRVDVELTGEVDITLGTNKKITIGAVT